MGRMTERVGNRCYLKHNVPFHKVTKKLADYEDAEEQILLIKSPYPDGMDKEELLKILVYNRKQYDKGYVDGYAEAIHEFAHKMIIMMPGHKEDILEIAKKLKGGVEDGKE